MTVKSFTEPAGLKQGECNGTVEQRRNLTDKMAEITGERYCTRCANYRKVPGGRKVGSAWRCAKCLALTKPPKLT